MNFTTDLPKRDPVVSYIVASAVKCEKFFPGSSNDGPVFWMHAVILSQGSPSLNEFDVNPEAYNFILCHVRKVNSKKAEAPVIPYPVRKTRRSYTEDFTALSQACQLKREPLPADESLATKFVNLDFSWQVFGMMGAQIKSGKITPRRHTVPSQSQPLNKRSIKNEILINNTGKPYSIEDSPIKLTIPKRSEDLILNSDSWTSLETDSKTNELLSSKKRDLKREEKQSPSSPIMSTSRVRKVPFSPFAKDSSYFKNSTSFHQAKRILFENLARSESSPD